ncbi:unnamed protein product [Schistocephalus solidus]|uniref:Protein kinase domain-containing protein n=1 Tax=Schistocephalus solidus TaxID=70667 RepID=A0A183SL55_SCHSO|nr:unnamed protein product [Schistocephalus solidus]
MVENRPTGDKAEVFPMEEKNIFLQCAMAFEIDLFCDNSRYRVNKCSSAAALREETKGINFPIFFHVEHNICLECGPVFADVIVMSRELVKVFPSVGETIILVPVLRESCLLVAWTQQLVLPTTDAFLMTLARTVSDSGFILSVSCSTERNVANIRKDMLKSQKTTHDLTQLETLAISLNILRANLYRLYRNHLSSIGMDLKEINFDVTEADVESNGVAFDKFEKLQELVDTKADESYFEIINTNFPTESIEASGSRSETNFSDVIRFRPLEIELGCEGASTANPNDTGRLFGQEVTDAQFGMLTSAVNWAKMSMAQKKPKYHHKALVYLDSVLKAHGRPVFLKVPLLACRGQIPCSQRSKISEYSGILTKDADESNQPEFLLSLKLEYWHPLSDLTSTMGGHISRLIVIIPGQCLESNSGSCSANPTQYAINTAKRIINEVNNEACSLSVSNSLEKGSTEHTLPPPTPKVTGFFFCDPSGRHIFFIETSDGRLARKLTFIFCQLTSQYTRSMVGQAPRILYNTTLKFASQIFMKIHHLCLRAPLHKYVERGLLYIRDLVPEPAFEALTRLYTLSEHCFSFSVALRLNLLPDPAGIQALCQHFCFWSTDS